MLFSIYDPGLSATHHGYYSHLMASKEQTISRQCPVILGGFLVLPLYHRLLRHIVPRIRNFYGCL